MLCTMLGTNTTNTSVATTSLTTIDGVEIQTIQIEKEMENKSFEISNLLEQQEYIEIAIISIFESPYDNNKVYFSASLYGEQLGEHINEIVELISQNIENCDIEHSSIQSITGEIFNIN